MAKIIWTSPALDDLNDIAEYIAVSNVSAAKKLVQTVFDKVDRLENLPESGRKPPELSNLNYREIIVNPCRIFYKIEGSKVFILHVMRQERNLRKFLLM
ncbi:MAG: type II toxin-antitoxin system RelE/ParE family toxin [Thiomicrorhabdus sp.]|nr:type II toxin-antitoxin system RelE/ParE family toxin [Thiomicrorhabdus sp.]